MRVVRNGGTVSLAKSLENRNICRALRSESMFLVPRSAYFPRTRLINAITPEIAAVRPASKNPSANTPAMKDSVSGSKVSTHRPNRKKHSTPRPADHLNTLAAFGRLTGAGVGSVGAGVLQDEGTGAGA